mmetsp:Transcript_7982/g.13497  ORF Transcript_7982/g.13497 Transcript_7982/m.13497 type:complete len:193 (+) Transcript_7982:87-665(+)
MDIHPLLSALSSVSTSNQWSVLESLLPKVNKKLQQANQSAVNTSDLCELLHDIDESTLELHGIWKHGFSKGTIVCTNPAFARACMARDMNLGKDCSCRAGSGHRDTDEKKYFNSHDYNGGRHACTQSKHIANCPLWRPAPTSHLHSWRRGYDDAGAHVPGQQKKKQKKQPKQLTLNTRAADVVLPSMTPVAM